MEEGGKEQCVDIKCGQKRRVHMAIFAFSKQTFFPLFLLHRQPFTGCIFNGQIHENKTEIRICED